MNVIHGAIQLTGNKQDFLDRCSRDRMQDTKSHFVPPFLVDFLEVEQVLKGGLAMPLEVEKWPTMERLEEKVNPRPNLVVSKCPTD